MNIRLEIQAFDELSLMDLHELLALRSRVFVVEQEITEEPEVDGRDPRAHHVLMWDERELVGTTRILLHRDPVKVGRVAVAKSHRGLGLGSQMMRAVGEFLGLRSAKLHAQCHLEHWYESLGWRRNGDNFDIVGISHVRMDWPPQRQS